MRSQLLTAITTAISTNTQFGVSSELPWVQNGQPLYLKNLKRVYIDKERTEQTTLIPTLDGVDIYSTDKICEVYVACDAKNTPSQLDSLITNIQTAKGNTGLVNAGVECDYTLAKQEDVLIYTFEFRMNTVTT